MGCSSSARACTAMLGGSSIFCPSDKPTLDFDPGRAGPTGHGGMTNFARFRTVGAINNDIAIMVVIMMMTSVGCL